MEQKRDRPKETIIRTPDHRLRVFISSTLRELADEREAIRQAILQLHLVPIMFEAGARPHPARELYQAYLAQSHVFIGIYWQSYGWVAPDMRISGLEDEYNLSAGKPRLIYIKQPAPAREAGLNQMLARIQNENTVSYKHFATTAELGELVENDLALLLTETFETTREAEGRKPAPDLPTGTVTFLFTDLEGSTQLWERHPQAMQVSMARHDALLRAAVEANHGTIIKTTGDGLHAVFASAADAAQAVLAGQRALLAEPWPAAAPLRVRMALHTGEADLREGDYYGSAVNRAARLMAVASGGQNLISQATAAVLQDRLPPQTSLRDLGEHSLKDLVRPECVYQRTAPDLPADFPRLKSLNAFPHNLPVQLTSFVGREREIAEARRLLSETHLLTLTGSGGTGKTRLSLQIAAEVLPEYPHGAWLAELAPLADAAYLVPALAAVFGVREQAGRPLLETVTDYLRAKNLLLLLDNCEHLIGACAHLAEDLLHACPGLKILATSREALGLAGETAYRVPSLALPDPHVAAASPAGLARSEAARLFVERARAAQPRFALTERNAPAVAALCRRLDGIPLALELAAARVGVLQVEQILARLDDRFRLLVGGSRTALPRQKTLRALIDWSYDLLPEDERRLLRVLSLFAGGCTLEAAEAVGNAKDEAVHPSSDVLDLLTQLVNKSLVAVDDDGPAARYRLLETVRQYAREKLMDAPGGADATAARDRHLAFFVQLSEAAEPRLRGADMLAALDELEVEQDNLRAALEWALDHDPLAAMRLVAALWMFFGRRTAASEGRHWAAASLAAADTPPSPALAPLVGQVSPPRTSAETGHYQGEPGAGGAGTAPGAAEPASLPSSVAVRAWVLVCEAWLAFQSNDYPATVAAAKAVVALARPVDAPRALIQAMGWGAMASAYLGDLSLARTWADECLALSRQHGSPLELSLAAALNLGLAVEANQAVPLAVREEALRVARTSGNPWAKGVVISGVARAASLVGDLDAAYAGYAEATAVLQPMRDPYAYNFTRSEMGRVLRQQGRYAAAAALYAETLRVWQELGNRPAVAHELECLGFIAAAGGHAYAEHAATLLGAAEALREAIGSPMTTSERREYDPVVAQLRAGAEQVQVEAAWAKGRALALDEAVVYALAELRD